MRLIYNVEWLRLGSFKLTNIGFELKEGDVFFIVGPNGSGKTAILYSILGLLKYKGVITINGANPSSWEARSSIAFLPEKPFLYERVSGRYNIDYFLLLNEINPKQFNQKIEQLSKELGLEKQLEKKCEQYSQGQKRKINLIQAYLIDRPINLLDDFESNFDEAAIEFIFNWIKSKKDAIFILTSATKIDPKSVSEKIGRKVKILRLEGNKHDN